VIYKRGKSWRVIVYVGRDPLTGRKRQKSVSAKTKAEAKELEAKIILEAGAGQHRAAGSRTVGELLERWFEWRKGVKPISPTTVVSYRALIELLILPALGKLPLRRLDAATLDAFYTQLRARGGKCPVCHERHRAGLKPLRPGERYPRNPEDQREQIHQPDCATGLPLSASRVRHVHAILSGALKQAVVWGWISTNPARLATPPAAEKADIQPPTAEDAARLLRVAAEEDPQFGLLLRLAVVLGVRRGELCRLRWSDVDLDQGEVLVSGSLIAVRGQPLAAKDTKTHAKRRIAIGAGTVDLLKAHRVERAKTALACGATLGPHAYVFSHAPDGSRPMHPDSVSHAFSSLAKRLGVACRLHDLRHFMVTQLVAGGVDWRTVSGRAGHADGHVTLTTYAHFQQAQDRKAAELMEGLLTAPATPAAR
jgi:integrase